MENKKIYFVFAPVFLHWPVAFVKEMSKINGETIQSGGFIGGPKKYHDTLIEELKDIARAEDLIYTHDLEKEWIFTSYQEKDLLFFKELLGDKVINEFIIADRHIGNGLLTGGGVSGSPMLAKLRSDKESYLNYIINMLRFLYDFLNSRKPDIIYSYAVAGAFSLAIAELCQVLGICFLKLTHSRVENNVVIDTDPRYNMHRIENVYRKMDPLNAESVDWAANYLDAFRKNQEQPDYQKFQNNVYKEKTTLKYTLKLWAKRIKGSIDRSNNFFHNSYTDIVKYQQQVARGIRKFWKDRPFYNSQDLIHKNFILYTLHVDPEASTMVISPYQTNQLAVIEALAKAKPIDHIVLVKEHLTMIGRRPKGFYDKINQMPGVYLIDPTEVTFPLILRSRAVITLTGTVGLEAVLLGKPVIFLGNFIYKFIQEGFVLTNDLSALPQILNNLDAIKPAKQETVIRLLACIKQESFPFDGGLIWSGVSKQKVLDNPEVVNLFAKELLRYLV